MTRLGDIATVTSGLEDPYQRKYRFNGHDSVQLGVVMAKGFNVTDVGKDVEATYKRFEEALPYGVAVDQISDQPEVVKDAVSEFMEALGEALLIVLVVSFLSIGWRSGLVIAIAIPLVLAATFAIMYELGIDLQRISLGALIIALGLLVDDAMIVVEMMERKLEEGLVKIEAASFAYSSTAFPMLTGTLITTAGFIPVGFAASTAGEYVRTLFYVVGIALVVSWFVAVYFTPWLGHMILKQRKHAGSHHDVFDTRFYRRLRATVGWAVRHRIIVLVMTLVTFATSLWAFQFIPQNFFPQSSRPEILVDLWLPEGTSIKEVETQAKALEAKMMDDKDKRFIATYIGEGAPRFFLPLDQQLRNPNFAQLLVMANDEPARERLIVKLRTILAQDFPSIRAKVDRLFLGPPTGWPVQMRVMGPDRQEVRRIADQVKAKFARKSAARRRPRRLAGAGAGDEAGHRPGSRPRARRHLAAHPPDAAGDDVRRAARRFPRRRGDGVHRRPRAGGQPQAAVLGRLGLYPDRFRRLRAAVAGGQGRAGARAGHRMAARPPADHQRARARCRTACSRTTSSPRCTTTCRACATVWRPATRSRSRAVPRIRPKARPRSPPRRRSCWPSSSCC